MPWDQADLVVFSKAFGAVDVAAAQTAHERGVPIALDLCDNIFLPAYGANSKLRPADAFLQMARVASLITCTTEPMAQLIREQVGRSSEVCVVPDSVEDEALVRRQKALLDVPLPAPDAASVPLKPMVANARIWLMDQFRRLLHRSASVGAGPSRVASASECLEPIAKRTIIWFGNHGSEHGDHGLNDILRFQPALESVAKTHDAGLLVVSNHQPRFEQLIAPLAMPTQYLEWSPAALAQALQTADVTIVPNSLDAFSIGKSANRSVMSICAGVPVVATPTSALEPLAGAVWTDEPAEGLAAYLASPEQAARDVQLGRSLVEKTFSLSAVGRQWQACFAPLVS